ncbi:cysteine--tRNA ligase [Candidatus Poribacteria bacterium]|nr:cysteine--tRNA ligase [Candidatus Poribacteria bacterium]
MGLRIYNSLTNQIDEFIPIEDGKVSMYNCGPTVYDYFHIGNARTFLVADIIRRYLEYKGYQVKFVQNFTDIDDKIINRANEEGVSASQLSSRYIEAYFEDSEKLGIRPADVHPKATDHIPEIIQLIERMVDKGIAYEVDGDIYYRIHKFLDYGKLSNRKPEDLLSGARVGIDKRKENPRDFDLWKNVKPNEPSWSCPWGCGRPGWHIECSAMAIKHLGESIDIHAGGQDLQFPHHENEIAQSEVLTGKTFARYWVHTAFLRIGGNRMGKSEQNFIFVRDALKDHSAEAIRHFLVSAHYRSPLDYNATSLSDSDSAIRRLNNCLERIGPYSELADSEVSTSDSEITRAAAEMLTNFELAMDEDFNTALAMGEIYKLVGHVNRFLTQEKLIQVDRVALGIAYQSLIKVCMVLGIYSELESIPNGNTQLVDQLMELVIDIRNDSRLRKDWVMADKVRDRLHEVGIELRDTPSGTNWEWRGD